MKKNVLLYDHRIDTSSISVHSDNKKWVNDSSLYFQKSQYLKLLPSHNLTLKKQQQNSKPVILLDISSIGLNEL